MFNFRSILVAIISQHFALSEKYVLMLAYGKGRWAVSQHFALSGK